MNNPNGLPTLDDYVRAVYPPMRLANQRSAPEGVVLPLTFDECDDEDKEALRGLVRRAMRETGVLPPHLDTVEP